MNRCRRWAAALLLSLVCVVNGQAASWATTPEPKPDKVARTWECVPSYDTPTPPAPGDPTPAPRVTSEACAVTDWYTPDPAPITTATVTETPSPVGTATVTADSSEVVLAPEQFDKLDTFAGTGVFAVGGLLLLAIAAFVFYLSAPPSFGLRRH